MTEARARLGALRNGKVAFLEQGPQRRETFSRARLQPVHASTMGLALLAFSPPAQVNAVINHGTRTPSPQGVTSTAHLRRALGTIQRTRVAVDCAVFEPDLCALAAPVFGPGGRIAAVLELAVPAQRGNHTRDPCRRAVPRQSQPLAGPHRMRNGPHTTTLSRRWSRRALSTVRDIRRGGSASPCLLRRRAPRRERSFRWWCHPVSARRSARSGSADPAGRVRTTSG